jgi:penicillin-binding protein 2
MEIDDAVLTLTEGSAANLEWPLNRISSVLLFGLMALALIGLGGRVFYLNVVEGGTYQRQARENSIRARVVPAPRGIFYDHTGKQLVHNVPSVDLVLNPRTLPADTGERTKVRETLQAIFGIDEEAADAAFDTLSPRDPSPRLLKEKLSQEETFLFLSRRSELPGTEMYQTTHRRYEDSAIFSHVLGYEGKSATSDRNWV